MIFFNHKFRFSISASADLWAPVYSLDYHQVSNLNKFDASIWRDLRNRRRPRQDLHLGDFFAWKWYSVLLAQQGNCNHFRIENQSKYFAVKQAEPYPPQQGWPGPAQAFHAFESGLESCRREACAAMMALLIIFTGPLDNISANGQCFNCAEIQWLIQSCERNVEFHLCVPQAEPKNK